MACTNSPGSLAKAVRSISARVDFNERSQTPADFATTLDRCRHTQTHPPLITAPPEGALNDAVLVHPNSPLTRALCPLMSSFPPSLPCLLSSSPLADPGGGIVGYELERQEGEHPGERYVTCKHPPLPPRHFCHTHLAKRARAHSITGNGARSAGRENMIRSYKHTRNHAPSRPKRHRRQLNTPTPHKS